MNLTTKPYNEIDKAEFSRGFERGNYAHGYENQDYRAAQNKLCGETGFFRVGFLLGFYSSFELHEVPFEDRKYVERHRKEFEKEGWV
jgi:hypothetical protein